MHEVTYLSAFIIIYVYLLYPVVLYFLSKVINQNIDKMEQTPNVCLMIAAYNEEKYIEEKLQNSLELDYPKDKLDIVVVSDASSDNTDSIVESYASQGIRLIRIEGRVGKTEARSLALREISAEIIVFSDATTEYDKDAISMLTQNFNDPKVGMVSGLLRYRSNKESSMGIGQKLFWTYESALKRSQTKLGTLTGSLGCMTAFRKELYTELPANIIEDFTGPLLIIQRGFKVVFENRALCYEETTLKSKEEWNMRIRVIRGGLTGLSYARKVLNPIKYPLVSFQLFSHKILRWIIPIIAILLLIANTFSIFDGPTIILKCLFVIQVMFYTIVFLAFLAEKFKVKIPVINIPYYLFIVNLASLVALYKFITEELDATWETNREGMNI